MLTDQRLSTNVYPAPNVRMARAGRWRAGKGIKIALELSVTIVSWVRPTLTTTVEGCARLAQIVETSACWENATYARKESVLMSAAEGIITRQSRQNVRFVCRVAAWERTTKERTFTLLSARTWLAIENVRKHISLQSVLIWRSQAQPLQLCLPHQPPLSIPRRHRKFLLQTPQDHRWSTMQA